MIKKQKNLRSKMFLLPLAAVGILLTLTGFLYSSFALVEPIRSISFTSEKLNYTEKEPGSWKIEKSAEWTNKGKARITFDIDTILKTEGKNTDIIFVLDISESMHGEKLDRVKQDSTELVNTLLSDSNNMAALVTFDTGSKILSELTNNKDSLVNLINNLSATGTTNYYQALINVDNILKNYTQSYDRNCIILFLTDGYPCEDVPNEEVFFKYLKQKYPYIVVNGIQYEMGNYILDPVKKISDNQYLANMKTLNNILFEASVVPTLYDNFVLTDYIDTDNFTVENVSDIKISQGRVEFDKEEQKIIWSIDYLRTGNKPIMTIDVTQKEESKIKELVSTNKKETVSNKIEKIEENVTSTKTPILKDTYQVIYEENAPTGCTISNIPSIKSYNVFDKVEIENSIPTCEGYQFDGWKIITSNVKKINSNDFEMPESDVVLRAEWTNLSLTKSMNGEIYIKMPSVLQKIGSSNYDKELWQYKDSITKIVFQNEINNIPGAVETFDISEEKDLGVMGYLVLNSDDTSTYTAYIQGDGKIIANQDSSYLFWGFTKLQSIEGLKYLNTSNVRSMICMFDHCSSLISLDLSEFYTYKVKKMNGMFNYCSNLTGLNLSKFDTSNVDRMNAMFQNCSSLENLDISNFNTSNVIYMNYMFYNCSNLKNLDISNFDTSKVIDTTSMFYECSGLTSLDVGNFDTSNVIKMGWMFMNCSNLISLNLSNFNTSKVTIMKSLFNGCKNLTNLNISGFNTSNVTDMSYMFQNCKILASLDVSNLDTSNVVDMTSMFGWCENLKKLDVSHFNTSKVTNMTNMFRDNILLEQLDVTRFDTSNVTTMQWMFGGTHNLQELNLSNFNTSKVTDMTAMFAGTGLLNLDLSNFDTNKVQTMRVMFSNANNLLYLNLDGFSTTNVTNMTSMFSNCFNLSTTITISNNNITASNYSNIFAHAASNGTDAIITVNFVSSKQELASSMVNTKIGNSNIILGTVNTNISNITIVGNDNIRLNTSKQGENSKLISIDGKYTVTSFKMNGVLQNGNSFTVNKSTIEITDIMVKPEGIMQTTIDYPSMSDMIYDRRVYDNAMSLNVTVEYNLRNSSTPNDQLSLYDINGNLVKIFEGKNSETITISGNTIRMTFTSLCTSTSGDYTYKIVVTPNYD